MRRYGIGRAAVRLIDVGFSVEVHRLRAAVVFSPAAYTRHAREIVRRLDVN